MAVGSVVGGYLAAAVGRKVNERLMRGFVVVVGIGMGVAMGVRYLIR